MHTRRHPACNLLMQTVASPQATQLLPILHGTESQAFTSWLRRGLASRAIFFLCSSFTGIRGLKNFGG